MTEGTKTSVYGTGMANKRLCSINPAHGNLHDVLFSNLEGAMVVDLRKPSNTGVHHSVSVLLGCHNLYGAVLVLNFFRAVHVVVRVRDRHI